MIPGGERRDRQSRRRASPGARWARQVSAGDTVAFTRPQGRLVLRDPAPYHLFVGDETACAAFGAMLASKLIVMMIAIPISYNYIFQKIPATRWVIGKSRSHSGMCS